MASKDKRTNNKEAYEEENDPLNPDNTQVKIVDKSYIYEEDESQNPSPFVGASWISLITFWWLNGLIRRGWKEQLTKKQIQKLRPKDDSEVVTANLQAYWDKNKVTDDTDINYLWRGILSVYWKHFVLGGICQIFRLGLLVPQPVFITLIVKYLRGNEDVSMQEAYLSAAAVVACTFLYTIPYTMYRYTIGTSAVRARAAISAMIFTKMLKLSERGWQGTTTGSIINLLASDVEKLQFGMLYLNLTWPACIIGSVVSGLLFWTFGTAFLAGLGVYIIAVISQVVFGLRIGKMRLIIGERGDKRQTLMHDIISAIKMIKIHCWEDPYADQVSAARKQEVAAIRKMGILSSPMEVINTVTGRVAIFFTLLVYALQGNQWTITDILYLIAWCELVRLALCGDLLIGSYYGAEVYFSSLRIQKFLVRDEETKKEPSQRSNEKSPAYSINIENLKVTLKTDSNKSSQEKDKLMDDGNEEFSLNIESLKIKHGSLVAVIGEVGSGKSTLFSTILGEITPKQGHVLTHGTVAYVPQNNWIFSETIRENILFGSKVSQRYHDVLHVCSLEEDLNIFPAGDQTQVGEYGWSLSGGQKSRINLARAAFTEKDVYLLDDPLSAVDGKVGETIFERCILKYLSNKTRILVTHQLQYLNQCDWVVIVHNGHLVEQGTFSDVSQTEAYKHLQYKREEKQSSSNYYVGTEKAPLAPWANGVGEEEYLQIKSGDGADEVSLNKTSRKLDIKVWWHYLTAGTLWGLAICVYSLLTFASIMCMVLADWWLLNWIQPADFEVSMYNTSNGSVAYMNITASSPDYIAYRDYQLEVYAVIIIGLIVAAEIRSLVFFIYTPSAAESLHNRMFKRIINAPIAFFEKTSVGRVLNRFSRDTNFMDELLPRNLSQVLTVGSLQLILSIVIIVIVPWLAIFAIPVFIFMVVLRHYAMYAICDLKRLEAICRAPVYAHLSNCIHGIQVIKAFKKQDHVMKHFHQSQNVHSSVWLHYYLSSRWLSVRFEWGLILYLMLSLVTAFWTKHRGIDGVLVGLSLTYMLNISYLLQYLLNVSVETETCMTSVERILEYSEIAQELDPDNVVPLPNNWPSHGCIQFRNVSLSYNANNSAPALSDLNFTINPREKVGLIGRTGAGKSSLFVTILRLTEPSGDIYIDNVDIGKIKLKNLRYNISVIPQDPVLVRGTVRTNLDPWSNHSDADIWSSIQKVYMSERLNELGGGLDCTVAETGNNFSVGQRQLLCLARALLKKNRILLIDEATANVDQRTDSLIQQALREAFKDCTVLTIAHRLHTIMDSDRIMVLDKGTLEEFASPEQLLGNSESLLSQLINRSKENEGETSVVTNNKQTASVDS